MGVLTDCTVGQPLQPFGSSILLPSLSRLMLVNSHSSTTSSRRPALYWVVVYYMERNPFWYPFWTLSLLGRARREIGRAPAAESYYHLFFGPLFLIGLSCSSQLITLSRSIVFHCCVMYCSRFYCVASRCLALYRPSVHYIVRTLSSSSCPSHSFCSDVVPAVISKDKHRIRTAPVAILASALSRRRVTHHNSAVVCDGMTTGAFLSAEEII